MLGEREKPKSYHSCAVSAKEPRLLVKELQRMFGENKLLLRASGASFVKGDKNKTRFDIVIYKVRGVSVFMISFVQEPCLVVIFLTVAQGAGLRWSSTAARQGIVCCDVIENCG